MQSLRIRRPDDFHVHLRQGEASLNYARDARDAGFARVLAMPNLLPPITSPQQLTQYRDSLEAAAPGLQILPTFKLMPGMEAATVAALARAGAVAGKYYPSGATTNSADGFRDFRDIFPIAAAMEEEGLVLCLHGEDPEAFSMDRESVFLPRVRELAHTFPGLKIIMEHISTAEGLTMVLEGPENLAGTLTIHHLLYDFDDLAGGSLKVHLFCKPLLKRPQDRQALRMGALSGHPRLFYGSDSAPHTKENKETCLCSAGVYSMPVSLPLLVSFFEEAGKLDLLEDFVSRRGAEFYGLPLNEGTLEFTRETWTVPGLYHGTVPLKAGEELPWKLVPSV